MKNKNNGKKSFIIIFFCLLLLIILPNCFYTVNEQEQAVITTFGIVSRTETAGFHTKIPFIEKVHKVDITTHGIGIGYTVDNNGQNITVEDDGIMITSDFNLVNVDFYMEYKVNDPVAYLYNVSDPEDILTNTALSCIRSSVTDMTVDEVMTTGKGQLQSTIKDKLTEELSKEKIGIQVVNITVQDAEPPTNKIKKAFKSVETAKQSKETAINNANKYKSEQIPDAEAKADKIKQDAEAEKKARIAEAEGQAERFNKLYTEYEKYPEITKKRIFYETMEDILPDLKVIITDGNTQTLMPLEEFSKVNN